MESMTSKRLFRLLACAALAAAPTVVLAQFSAPNVTTAPGSVTTNLGSTIFVNQGLVGVGRISASAIDPFGETFGSVSGLQVTNWVKNPDGSYSGVFNVLPDRGYNSGSFFADYHARINQIGFAFTPYTGSAGIGGATIAEKLAAQNQIRFTTPVTGVRFTYDDPIAGPNVFTTGLDPGPGYTTGLFAGQALPYVFNYSGPQAPGPDCAATPAACQTYTINRLALDSEALILKADGSGYIGDEYGGYIYYFNPAKKILGAILPPPSMQPHFPAGVPNHSALVTPVNGRRNNQGLEGVALSPDGTRLFALLQSATIQDSDGSQQNRRQTRLLVYDVSGTPTPIAPINEYAMTLPTLRANGQGGAATTLNRTAAQSEIVALDNARILVLSRDGNGLGLIDPNPSVYKSILLVDTTTGAPTDFAGVSSRDSEGGKITAAPGVLDPLITPLQWTEAVNILNSTQLTKFNVELDTSGLPSPYQVSKLTLGEKWEGLSLVPAQDPNRPNDYFLFVGNDDDFLTSNGRIRGPDGTIVSYNGFAGYSAARLPAPVDSPNNENDTLFLAYRVTIISGAQSPTNDLTPPEVAPIVTGTLGANAWYTSNVTVTWNVADGGSGIASLSGCGPSSVTSDTTGITLTCTATNGAGLTSTLPITIKIDKTAPTLVPPSNQTVQQLTATGTAVSYPAPVVSDAGSGVAASSCAPTSGSTFPVGTTTVACTAKDNAGNTRTATFTVTVKPAPDHRMYGVGYVDDGGVRSHFVFRVSQFRNHDYGRLEFWTNDGRQCAKFDDDDFRDGRYDGDHDQSYGRRRCNPVKAFESSSIDSVIFIDDPAFGPGRSFWDRKPTSDTVKFSGRGKWNGRAGYTFEAIATDRGEPGARRDTFSIVIKDAQGRVVVSIDDTLSRGNIQSTSLLGLWW
jgi:hypothetical protein